MNKSKLMFSAAAAAFVAGSFTPVFAQDASTATADDEIVVTAQGRTERLQDVPVAVSVTAGAQLRETNIRDLQDLSARLPNVKITVSATADFVNIRGVGSSANAGFEQSVATFVDGVYRGRSRSTRSALFDIDRIEVLRGPQTTYFGNNAIAGALNITTRKPGNEFAVNGTAYYAPNFGAYTFEAGVDAPLTKDLSMRVAGRAEGMKGYFETAQGKGPHLRSYNGRVSLAWRPESGVEVDARVDVGRQNDKNNFSSELVNCAPDASYTVPLVAGGSPLVPAPAAGPCARYIAGVGLANVDDEQDYRSSAGPSGFKMNFVEAELHATIPVGTHSIVLTSGFYKHDNEFFYDAIAVPAAYRSHPAVGSTIGLSPHYFEDFRQVSQEVRLRSPTGGFIEYLAGVYIAHTSAKYDNSVGYYFADFGASLSLPIAPKPANPNHSGTAVALRVTNEERSTTISGFGAFTVNVSDQLKINVGGRYTSVDKSATRTPMVGYVPNKQLQGPNNFVRYGPEEELFLATTGGLAVQMGEYDRPTRTDAKFMPTAGIQFKVTPDVMLYGTYAKGFKAGGYSALTVKSDFRPEVVDNFEIGFKSSFLNNRLTFNLAAFHAKYKDLQESITVINSAGVSVGSVANVASSISKGIELNVVVKPVTGLTLSADVAYLDAKYTNYPGGPCTARQSRIVGSTCTRNLGGVQRPFAPEWSGNASVSYVTPITDGLKLSLMASTYFSASYFLNPVADPYLAQSAFAKIDARIALGQIDGQWELAVVGKNLNNKITTSYALAEPGALGTFIRLADAPRTVGFQGTFKF